MECARVIPCPRCRCYLVTPRFYLRSNGRYETRCRKCQQAHDIRRDPATRHGTPRNIAQRKRVCRPLPKVDRDKLNAMRVHGCALCDAPAQHRDHIVPISRGGQHTLDNLRWLCAKHNTSKGSKLDSEWMTT